MRRLIEAKLASGEIGNMAQLLSFLSDLGWTLTRKGATSIGFTDGAGKRMRLKMPFPEDLGAEKGKRRSRRPELRSGYWIYALLASAGPERACYIGQTVDYLKRVRGHIRERQGRSSWELFRWAEARDVDLRFVLLDFIPSAERDPAIASEATLREGLWFYRAQAAGYRTPGSDRWARFPPLRHEDMSFWPEEDVTRASTPLSAVWDKQLTPAEVAIQSVLRTYEAAPAIFASTPASA